MNKHLAHFKVQSEFPVFFSDGVAPQLLGGVFVLPGVTPAFDPAMELPLLFSPDL